MDDLSIVSFFSVLTDMDNFTIFSLDINTVFGVDGSRMQLGLRTNQASPSTP